jgi:hypothetical protein
MTWGAELREVEHGSMTDAVQPVVVNGGLDAGGEWSECNVLRIPPVIAFVHAKKW